MVRAIAGVLGGSSGVRSCLATSLYRLSGGWVCQGAGRRSDYFVSAFLRAKQVLCPRTHLMKRDHCRWFEAGLIPVGGASLLRNCQPYEAR